VLRSTVIGSALSVGGNRAERGMAMRCFVGLVQRSDVVSDHLIVRKMRDLESVTLWVDDRWTMTAVKAQWPWCM
jgi:hypothetical protein